MSKSLLTINGSLEGFLKSQRNHIVYILIFIYLGFYIALNTVQVISRQVVGRADETSTYIWSRFCTVNCPPTASNYQLSHLRYILEPNPASEVGGECYHSATVAPYILLIVLLSKTVKIYNKFKIFEMT